MRRIFDSKYSFKLTIGINICFKSSITKINQMILSLFNKRMTCKAFESISMCRKFSEIYSTDEFNPLNSNLISLNEHVEIIVYMDGYTKQIYESTEKLLKIIQHRLKFKFFFKILYSEEIVGVSKGRNEIFKNASGKFVLLRDDDDLSVNINELLNILNSNYDSNLKYIECCMSKISNKYLIKPIFTGWYPTNVILNRDFIVDNKLFFVENIVGEDSVWRFDIYHKLYLMQRNEGCDSHLIKVIPKSIYMIYYESKKTLSENDQDNFKNMLTNIFEHEIELFGQIPLNPLLFNIASTITTKKNLGVNVASFILENYSERCEMSSYLNKIKSMNIQYIKFSNLNVKDRHECLCLFKKYFSTNELILSNKDNLNLELDSFASKYILLKVLNTQNVFGTENLSKFSEEEIQNIITASNSLSNLIDEFTKEFDDSYFIKMFIHMRGSHLTNNYYMQERSIKYHTIIENLSQPIDKSAFESEIINYDIDNSINDVHVLQHAKFSYSPIAIIIWCLLCSKVNVEPIKYVEPEKKHDRRYHGVYIFIPLFISIMAIILTLFSMY